MVLLLRDSLRNAGRFADRQLRGHVLVVLLLLSTCAYVAIYLAHPALPHGTHAGRGWLDWWDQGQYYRSALALAQGNLTASQHWYPLGYPLLGALFARVLPLHPFLLPNLLCFLGIVVLLYELYRSELSRLESVGLLLFVALQPLLLEHLAIPWTTIPTQLGTYAVIALLVVRAPTRGRLVWAALVAGGVVAVRPGDALFLAPIFAGALIFRGLADRRVVLRDVLTVAGVGAACLALVALGNKAIFDTYWLTPYTKIVGDIGFGSSALGLDAYALLVEARSLFAIDTPMLLQRYPWVLLVLPGVLFWLQRRGWRGASIVVSLLLCFAFYLSYNDFDASTAFRFSTVHYLLWALPILALFGYLTVRRAWWALRWRHFLVGLLAPFVAVGACHVTVDELAASPEIRFAGSPLCASALRDGDLGTTCAATFPLPPRAARDPLEILDVRFASPQQLRLIQLHGWPDDYRTYPTVELDGLRLRPNAEFRPAFGPRGLVLFLRRAHDARRLRLTVNGVHHGPLGLAELRFGRPRLALGGALARLLRSSPSARVRAWQSGWSEDAAGPWGSCLAGDGEPDLGVGFELPADLGARVRSLEVRSSGSSGGRWVSCGGTPAAWHAVLSRWGQTRAAPLSLLAEGGKFQLRLADNGCWERSEALRLIAHDGAGAQLFSVPVSPAAAPKQAPPARRGAALPLYALGATVDHRAGAYFVGWHDAERDFRWSTALSALRFRLDQLPAAPTYRLTLDTSFGLGSQAARVQVNHGEVATLDFPARPTVQHVNIPAPLLRSGPNLIVLHLPAARRPENGDRRRLGVALRSFKLEPVVPSSPAVRPSPAGQALKAR